MRKKSAIITLLTIFLILLLAGCNLPSQFSPGTSYLPPSPGQTQAKVTFEVSLPGALTSGDSLYLTLLDEVTGLAFNPHKYLMQADDATHYSLSLPLYLGKVIKYRYSREGASSVDEHLDNDHPVRYRLYHVEGPGTVKDVLSQWTDSQYAGSTGRIQGSVSDASTGKLLPNILVTAGGEQAFTTANGSFLLEGLPPGIHNLVFYALDGAYAIFQQGAVVAAGSTTPVAVKMTPTTLVTVIFTVKVPADTPPGAPIRMAGNLYQLGNTFADLPGGMSSLPACMPVLGRLDDGRYMVTLSLPSGTYVEYKYTLGDGLWSSELTAQGDFQLHQLIVPNERLEVNDTVESWGTKGTKPIRFEVKVPDSTPAADSISIQFNPGFGWMEPLPMSPATNSSGFATWRFDLTGPFNTLPTLHYRYCRNGLCGAADDAASMGIFPEGRIVSPAANPVSVQDEVLNWAWYDGPSAPPSVPGVQVNPRDPSFVAGIAFQPSYQPGWAAWLPSAYNDVQALGVNTVLLSPTWTFTNNTPPILEPQAQQDMLWPELVGAIQAAQTNHLSVGLFPSAHFPASYTEWWQAAARDYPWWASFFERYTTFTLHNASVAAAANAATLVLGGEWLSPALPNGTLADGAPSGVPQDAEQTWRNIIAQVRQRYSGTIAWALSYPDGMKNPPPFLDAVDQVYLLWSAPLASAPGAALEEMQVQAASILDSEVLPFQEQAGKPLILAISYPSIDRAATGCIAIQSGGCLDYAQLSPPNTDISALTLDLQAQANAYNAVLTAINERPWIAGYVSMGYYPPAVLQDKSTSVHGKPASGVLWYWSTKFLGK